MSVGFVHTQLNVKTVLFQAVQFSISTQFSSIWPIDRTLSGATTPGQSGPWSDSKDGVLRIPQSSCITGASPSDCLVSCQDTRWDGGLLQPQPTGRVEDWVNTFKPEVWPFFSYL